MAALLGVDDVAMLQDIIVAEKRRRVWSRRSSQIPAPAIQGSDALIVVTPADGISARTDMRPGFALCEMQRIVETDSPVISSLGDPILVYNLSDSDVLGATPILAVKDRFGSWIATGSLDDGMIPAASGDDFGTGSGLTGTGTIGTATGNLYCSTCPDSPYSWLSSGGQTLVYKTDCSWEVVIGSDVYALNVSGSTATYFIVHTTFTETYTFSTWNCDAVNVDDSITITMTPGSAIPF